MATRETRTIKQNINSLIRSAKELSSLRESDFNKYKASLGSRYSDLKYGKPTLFDIIVEDPDNFDFTRFDDMLMRMDRYKHGGSSKEAEDTIVGQDYFNEFVPQVLRESRTHEVSEIDGANPVERPRNDIANLINQAETKNSENDNPDSDSNSDSDSDSDDSDSDSDSDSDDSDSDSDSDSNSDSDSDSNSDSDNNNNNEELKSVTNEPIKTFKKEVIRLAKS
jgi:hypothetical protein